MAVNDFVAELIELGHEEPRVVQPGLRRLDMAGRDRAAISAVGVEIGVSVGEDLPATRRRAGPSCDRT